jgi:hypothetical protein
MKRKTSTVTLLAFLISGVAIGIKFVSLTNANFIPIAPVVESPAEVTYSANEVPLIFRVYVYSYYQKEWNLDTKIVEMFYSLDGKANVTIPITDQYKN